MRYGFLINLRFVFCTYVVVDYFGWVEYREVDEQFVVFTGIII